MDFILHKSDCWSLILFSDKLYILACNKVVFVLIIYLFPSFLCNVSHFPHNIWIFSVLGSVLLWVSNVKNTVKKMTRYIIQPKKRNQNIHPKPQRLVWIIPISYLESGTMDDAQRNQVKEESTNTIIPLHISSWFPCGADYKQNQWCLLWQLERQT